MGEMADAKSAAGQSYIVPVSTLASVLADEAAPAGDDLHQFTDTNTQ